MFNMIKLDWLGMKCYHKRIVIIPLTVCLYSFFHIAIIIPFMALMMLSFSVNPFAVEEKGKLDNLYLTLPVTRKSIVTARFGLSFIMQLAGIVGGTIFTVIVSSLLYGRTILFTHTFKAEFPVMAVLICASLLFYAVLNLSTFPILFKIGYAKGKFFGFIIPLMVVSVLIGVLISLWNINGVFHAWLLSIFTWSFNNAAGMAAILLAMAAMLLAVSYMLSCKVYEKREF